MSDCWLGNASGLPDAEVPILDNRGLQFFVCPAVPVARARNVIEQMPDDDVAAEAVERVA
jgi:hypothetical protein